MKNEDTLSALVEILIAEIPDEFDNKDVALSYLPSPNAMWWCYAVNDIVCGILGELAQLRGVFEEGAETPEAAVMKCLASVRAWPETKRLEAEKRALWEGKLLADRAMLTKRDMELAADESEFVDELMSARLDRETRKAMNTMNTNGAA